MDRKFETIIDNTVDKFTGVGVDVKGVLVCDKSGLTLTSKDVSNPPGPVARLTELAASLCGRRTTVCLEDAENQVLIHQTDKAVVAVYTKNAS